MEEIAEQVKELARIEAMETSPSRTTWVAFTGDNAHLFKHGMIVSAGTCTDERLGRRKVRRCQSRWGRKIKEEE